MTQGPATGQQCSDSWGPQPVARAQMGGLDPAVTPAYILRSSPAQVMELAERKRQEKQQEQEDNMTEITNLLNGELLSENPRQMACSCGPQRVVPGCWKGMNREQLEEIWFTQKQQIQEKLVSPIQATESPLHP